MNKFVQNIAGSAEGIKLQRVTVVATQAKLAQEALIGEIKRQHASTELQLSQLLDLAPETTDSLRPVSGFEPNNWVRALHETKLALKEITAKLVVAEETYAEWFTEVPTATSPTVTTAVR